MRDRLIKLLGEHCSVGYETNECTNPFTDDCAECLADYILADGWIRPPYEIGTKVYATIGSLSLPIPYAVYEVTIQRYVLVKGGLVPVVKLKKGAVTYGDIHTSIDRMYDTKEEAEKALKGGESDA